MDLTLLTAAHTCGRHTLPKQKQTAAILNLSAHNSAGDKKQRVLDFLLIMQD